MQEFPATEAKDKWGLITEAALQHPVTITRHGRPSLVVTSVDDYRTLMRIKQDQLKTDIQIALDQVERGEVTQLGSDGDINEFFEGVKARGRARLKKQDGHVDA